MEGRYIMIKKFVLCATIGILLSNCAFASNCKIVHKSVKFYEKLIVKDANNVCAFYNLANEYYLKKKYQKALNTYNDIIILFPKEEDAYQERVYIYYKFKEDDKAYREYGRLIKNIPDSIKGNEMMSGIYQNISDYDNALKYINKAIDLAQGKKPSLYYDKANILKDIGRYEEAIKNYSIYLQSSDEYNYSAYLWISECYKSLGNAAKEKENYAKWYYASNKNEHKISLIQNIKWYYHKIKPDHVY